MSKDRFGFGKNWKSFLHNVNDDIIRNAENSGKEWLGVPDLNGKTFLDVGSGSGLFSLAARNLGAKVYSFDYDKDSVDCARILKKKYHPGDENWHIERGDALSPEYLSKYDKCDIVYSWGVLHHTGNMYKGLDNVSQLVKDNGKLFIAIYNDQGKWTKCWTVVKKLYNIAPDPLKFLIVIPCFIRLWGPTTIKDFLRFKPFNRWNTYKEERGMSPFVDVLDWVGGYPFEVATPEEIFDFYKKRGFEMEKLYTCGGGHGCNQFLFRKI